MVRRIVKSWTSFFRELMGFQNELRSVKERLKILSKAYNGRRALDMDDKDLQRLIDTLEVRFNAFQLEMTAKMAEFTVELKNFGLRLVEGTDKQFKLFEDLLFKRERQTDAIIQQKGDEKKADQELKKEEVKIEGDIRLKRLMQFWGLITLIAAGMVTIIVELIKLFNTMKGG